MPVKVIGPVYPRSTPDVEGTGLRKNTRTLMGWIGGLGSREFRTWADGSFRLASPGAPDVGERVLVVSQYDAKTKLFAEAGRATVTVVPKPTTPPPPPPPAGSWVAEYFTDTALTGSPVRTETVARVGADWASGGPAGVPADRFSARYTGRFAFEAGEYEFKATADDGVRVYVDGALLIDEWHVSSVRTYTARKTLTAGEHTVKVEYYEDGGLAILGVVWAKAVAPGPEPTPDPEPIPVPTGSWFGRADPWAGKPFGSHPAVTQSGRVEYWNQTGITISGKTFRDRPGNGFLYIYGGRDIVVEDIDFDNVTEGIVAYHVENLTIRRIRARNIWGVAWPRTSEHKANLMQLVNCKRAKVSDLKLQQNPTYPDFHGTEDIVSLGGDEGPSSWGGTSWSDPFVVERFAFDGGGWTSPSGTGFFIGDGASGSYVLIRDGVWTNPGRVGIGTGEHGPYRLENLRMIGGPGTGKQAVNGIEQRTPRMEYRNVKVAGFGTALRLGTSYGNYPRTWSPDYVDLGGNDFGWQATQAERDAIRALTRV